MPEILYDKTKYLYLIILLAIGYLLYSNSIGIPYFADDYQLILDSSTSPLYYFYNDIPINHFYRPIQAAFLLLVQKNCGLDTSYIQITQVFLHILLSFFVYIYLKKFKYSTLQAILGSLYMLIAQTSVSPVAGNDTFSQVICAFFGYIALFLLVSSYHNDGKKRTFIAFSLLFFTLSLFSKESGISFLLMSILIIFAFNYSPLRLKKIFYSSLPFVIITIVYFLIRSSITAFQPEFGTSSRYQFNIGLNVIINSVLLLVNVFVPSSSVALFSNFQTRNVLDLIAPGLFFLIFILVVGYGIWDYYKDKKTILFLFLLLMTSFFPVMFMGKVSEQFTYNGLPLTAIVFGVSFGHLFKKYELKKLAFALLLIFTTILSVSHIYSTRTKIDYMMYNGNIATKMFNQIVTKINNVPPNGNLYLVNSNSQEVEYSVFLIKEFNYLIDGEHMFNRVSHRNDFTAQIIPFNKFKEKTITTKDYILHTRIERDSVIIY